MMTLDRLNDELVSLVLYRLEGWPARSTGRTETDRGWVRFNLDALTLLRHGRNGYRSIADLHGPGQLRIKEDVVNATVRMLDEGIRYEGDPGLSYRVRP